MQYHDLRCTAAIVMVRFGSPSLCADEGICSVSLFVANGLSCAVCKDEYGLDENVLKLPCKHLFHVDCVKPWLELVSTYFAL